APRDLIEDFAVEPIGRLAPLRRVAEVIPKAEADFSSIIAHDASLLAGTRRLVLSPRKPGSDLRRATVHKQLDAGDVGTVVGSEEHCGLAGIVGSPDPA